MLHKYVAMQRWLKTSQQQCNINQWIKMKCLDAKLKPNLKYNWTLLETMSEAVLFADNNQE
jgi:hypothetical protein